MGLLITPTAEIKSKRAVHNDHNLRHALAEDQLCDYLVRNMGYIELAQAGPSLGIKFCPIKSPIVALDAVLTFIGGSKFENFCLLIFDGEKWTDLLIQDRCSVERVLVDLFDARIDSEAGRFICSDLEINRQAITPDIELALDLSNDDGITTSDEIFDYLNNAFKGRYMVVRPTDDQFRVLRLGRGYSIIGNKWCHQAHGTPIENMPDAKYGYWIANAFRQVWQTNKPLLQTINAYLSDSNSCSHVVCYQRLIAPIQTKAEGSLLIGVTHVNSILRTSQTT